MADVSAKKQAEKILKAYTEDFEGLTKEACTAAGFTEFQSEVLVEVLGKGVRGEITAEEATELAKAGFVKEFIQEIAGSDGKKALEQRARFFASKVQLYIKKLEEPDSALRIMATANLRFIGDHPAVEPLITVLLKDTDNLVRVSAIWALSEIGDMQMVGPLITTLKDPSNNDQVRFYAVETLVNILEKEGGLIALIPYLRDIEQMIAGKDDACNENCQSAAGQVIEKLDTILR